MIYDLLLIFAVGAALFQTLTVLQQRRRILDLLECHKELTEGLSAWILTKKVVPPGREAQPKETPDGL